MCRQKERIPRWWRSKIASKARSSPARTSRTSSSSRAKRRLRLGRRTAPRAPGERRGFHDHGEHTHTTPPAAHGWWVSATSLPCRRGADIHAFRPAPCLHGVRRGRTDDRPAPRAAAQPADARAARARARRRAATASITLDLLGHGRVRAAARHVALLDDVLRRADDRAARPPRARPGRRPGHVAWAPTPRSRPRRSRPTGCAGWSSRCRCSTARWSPAASRSCRCCWPRSTASPAMRLRPARRATRCPRGALPFLGDVVLDTVRQDPGPERARCSRASSSAASRRTARERRTFDDADARHRPPARPGPPVLRRRDARRRAARTGACWRPARMLELRLAPEAPDGRDRRLHRRVLERRAGRAATARASVG